MPTRDRIPGSPGLFTLVLGGGWMLLPCEVEPGSLASVDGVVVTDVFGRRSWIEPSGAGPWFLFGLTAAPPGTGMFLPGTAGTVEESPPVEDVLLIRDENANMVWAIEQTVPLGLDARQDVAAWFGLRSPSSAAPTSPVR